MNKDELNILKKTSMRTPTSPYYIKGITNIRNTVKQFLKTPSFTDKIKEK
tara:strand:- start:478 stop:627 length:150 start_codon:yes stop_codon:yes gene_type:complete